MFCGARGWGFSQYVATLSFRTNDRSDESVSSMSKSSTFNELFEQWLIVQSRRSGCGPVARFWGNGGELLASATFCGQASTVRN